MLRINSLDALKKWNDNPTEEKPIVLDWFLNWFFEDLLMKDKYTEALEATEVLVKFTEICESLNTEEAVNICLSNFKYYSGYGLTKWGENFSKFRKEYWKK